MNREVVVTGLSIWSSYGPGTAAFWKGLNSPWADLQPVTRFSVAHKVFRSKKAASIAEIQPESIGDAEESIQGIVKWVLNDLFTRSCLAKSQSGDVSPYEVAVCVGSSQSTTGLFREHLRTPFGYLAEYKHQEARDWLSSGSVVTQIAHQIGARGPALMISTACASSTSSIGAAYNMIRKGRARRAFAGGIGYYTEITFTGFNILRLTSSNGCRPFDVNRDGIMFGDSVAFVLLEDRETAEKRGAKPIVRITGYASGNEAYHATSPDPEGGAAYRVMWNALGQSPELLAKLDYINAHGTGTLVNDKTELLAIRRLLKMRHQPEPVAISSTKGHHGHALGAAGAMEFIATVLAIQNQMAPCTAGLRDREPEFDDLNLVAGQAQPRHIRLALSNSFAFGGNVAAIALELPTESVA
jgi:3-oxoacyl-[acyl-carrier-protein] synthase II